MTAPLSWPAQATKERDRAGVLLHLLLLEARALKRLTRNGMAPDVLRHIGSDIYDYAAEGYRLLEREWPGIRKWPDRANEARQAAIETFYDAMVNGRRIHEIVKVSRQKYHRTELQEMADDLTYSVNEALNLMCAQGAPRVSLENDDGEAV